MSLNNQNAGKKPTHTTITYLIRNPKTESFGESVINDFTVLIGPVSKFVNSIYRNQAIKAIEKRNMILGDDSEYLNQLADANIGDNYSAWGNINESDFFNYIIHYCQMERLVFARNNMLGNTSPKIEEKLKNPPAANQKHITKMAYCYSITLICMFDMVKFEIGKLAAGAKEKKETETAEKN